MPLSPLELAYQPIQSTFDSLVTLVMANVTVPSPITTPFNDLLNEVLSMDEAIREILSL